MTISDLDILVVGAGPAGASAAIAASRAGASVLLVDRRRQIGLPVQCAEYIPIMLQGQLDLPAACIAQKVSGMQTFIAGQKIKETAAPGAMIHRQCFDQALADKATAAGAELRCGVKATTWDANGVVRLKSRSGSSLDVCPRVIIGADGPHSTVGAWVGVVNQDLLPAVQATLPLVNPINHTQIYFEPEIVAGYGWLFPKGDVANVGLGMRKPTNGGRSLRTILDDFVSRLTADGKVRGEAVRHSAGWIPVAPLTRAVHGNVMLVGDAAGHTHPITGAGVYQAVSCGAMAGHWAARALEREDIHLLSGYDAEWQDLFGRTLFHARKKRLQMESQWANFDDTVRSCWIAFQDYHV